MILALCGFASAQSFIDDFNKIRQIKLLESNRNDASKILTGFKLEDEDEDEPIYSEIFSTKYSEGEIEYSRGDCSVEGDEWNIPAGKVKQIKISPKKPISFAKFNLDFSSFTKEKSLFGNENELIFHNKNLGIAFYVEEDEITSIYLFPSNSYYSLLCENKEAEIIKEFYSTESFYGNYKPEDNRGTENYVPLITDLILSKTEIIIGCDKKRNKENCLTDNLEISVNTITSDDENDALTYKYFVSVGKIIGEGSKVIWDLTGVKPGTYTITATIDYGCGLCEEPKTKTVIIKE